MVKRALAMATALIAMGTVLFSSGWLAAEGYPLAALVLGLIGLTWLSVVGLGLWMAAESENALAAPSVEYRLSKPEDGESRSPEGTNAAPQVPVKATSWNGAESTGRPSGRTSDDPADAAPFCTCPSEAWCLPQAGEVCRKYAK